MSTYKITAEQLQHPDREILYPGVTEPGEYRYSEKHNMFYPVSLPVVTYDSMDIESGLGIGGIGSDDHNIHSDYMAVSRQRQHKCGGGQRYDEACANCGRITVICNDCELCERCHDED